MVRKLDFEKENMDFKYRRNVLEAILVSSLNADGISIPTIEEFVLGELINGTMEYMGLEPLRVDYREYMLYRNVFEMEISKAFKEQINASSQTMIDPNIKSALIKLSDCVFETNGPLYGASLSTELYTHFKGFAGIGGICNVMMKSKFELSIDYVEKIKKDFMDRMSDLERENVFGIGKAMRKYINKDLELIKKVCYW